MSTHPLPTQRPRALSPESPSQVPAERGARGAFGRVPHPVPHFPCLLPTWSLSRGRPPGALPGVGRRKRHRAPAPRGAPAEARSARAAAARAPRRRPFVRGAGGDTHRVRRRLSSSSSSSAARSPRSRAQDMAGRRAGEAVAAAGWLRGAQVPLGPPPLPPRCRAAVRRGRARRRRRGPGGGGRGALREPLP